MMRLSKPHLNGRRSSLAHQFKDPAVRVHLAVLFPTGDTPEVHPTWGNDYMTSDLRRSYHSYRTVTGISIATFWFSDTPGWLTCRSMEAKGQIMSRAKEFLRRKVLKVPLRGASTQFVGSTIVILSSYTAASLAMNCGKKLQVERVKLGSWVTPGLWEYCSWTVPSCPFLHFRFNVNTSIEYYFIF